MQFIYHKEAGSQELLLTAQSYRHVYLSRRMHAQEILVFRNLVDHFLYFYKPLEVKKHHAHLSLLGQELRPICPKRPSHLIWAIIASKNIEKVLPYLNQMGVGKISFFYAHFSQKNEKIDASKLARFRRILIASCEQCGRSACMQLEVLENTKVALERYPAACIFDFYDQTQGPVSLEHGIFIGPEGGFCNEERQLFKRREIYSPSSIILTSEGAALFLAAHR
ncbi:16S rRNA (uracil(1498)-N(3))-methyltransferase [Helicobacter suis]|uniref:16S rRNA (uracil(1498)-N(3))-methyltransferase n=1 Tax=Helicobacter suis TaxID=104628 RepID=UPI0013CFFFAD|nr:16S rRNA (uracil(1498)-N(3))-methyltransferase [Helicobacter suis]